MKASIDSLIATHAADVDAHHEEKRFATGTYTGTGVVRSITGLGFQPKAIIIISDWTAVNYFWHKSDTRSTWKSVRATDAPAWNERDNSIRFDVDGFSVGNDANDWANNNTKVFHYTAWG